MKRVVFATILFFLILAVPFAGSVFALTISPVRMEISGDPGQTLRGTIELFNEQDETKTFYSSTANFEARGESGAPYFLPETNKGLASWIGVEESVVLKAGEQKEIPFSIQIPQNTEGGGYFAAILWSVSPATAQGGGQVSIGGKLGALILLSVSGGLKEGGGLLDFKIEEGRRVLTSLPITFAYRFSNDGNERVKPTGEIKIKNIFGFTSATLDANSAKGNVLPGSIRKFSAVWQEKGQVKPEPGASPKEIATEEERGFFDAVKNQWRNFALGPYKAMLNISYGKLTEAEADYKKAEAGYRFFVFPWQLLTIIVLILAVIGFLGFWGLKKYNRWIIAKATQKK